VKLESKNVKAPAPKQTEILSKDKIEDPTPKQTEI
jgi:hypothetical protein